MSFQTWFRNLISPLKGGMLNAVDAPQPAPKKPVKPKLSERLVMNALSQDWVRETSRNQGEGIERYWPATSYPEGYKNREPYCAAFVCWAFREAMQECGIEETATFKRPKTAAAFGFQEWSLKQDGTTQTKLKPRGDIQRGDIVIFSFSHVGIATDHPQTDGHFPTIEANTGPGGNSTSNEGDGVYRKRRHIDLVRARIRLTL